ncbi:MAG: FkbM family methyltransferase [Rhizobiaceae bacterium]
MTQVEPNAEGRELQDIFGLHGEALAVVDIGSNAIEGAPPYRPLVEWGLAHVTGFEPQSETVFERPGERHLPYAIGNGKSVTFRTCAHSGWSSTLKPDASTLAVFNQYAPGARVTGEERMKTRRLDDIAEIERIDMLKIDIQGGELAVFNHGKAKLADTVFVHTEVAFMPLYEGQPGFGEVDVALRKQGFVPHTFWEYKRAIVSPFRIGNDPWQPIHQVLDGDIVYVRDFRKLEDLDLRQVKAMGLIAHLCYKSWDLAYFCVQHLQSRGELPQGACERYLAVVNRVMAEGA